MEQTVLRIAAACVLGTLLEYLLPGGNLKKSAAAGIRLLVLWCIAAAIGEWVG